MGLRISFIPALFLTLITIPSHSLFAKSCNTQSLPLSTCKIKISQLHPTQLSYGEREVQERSKKFADMSQTKLEKYLDKKTVPIVIGPEGTFFLTDHHHMLLALQRVFGMNLELKAEVTENWSELEIYPFQQKMIESEYFYLYDEQGRGPHPVEDLPTEFTNLRDDPYRSLAWGVRKAGGYAETNISHADFLWAQFFRSRIAREAVVEDFEGSIQEGINLANSLAAKELPGYRGTTSQLRN